VIAALLLVGGVLLPATSGHPHSGPGYRFLRIGDYYCGCEVAPYPLWSNASTAFTLVVTRNNSYAYPDGRIELRGPTGFSEDLTWDTAGGALQTETFSWGGPGNYSARFLFQDNGTLSETTSWYDVYLDASVRLVQNPGAIVAGRDSTLSVDVRDREGRDAVDSLTDLRLEWRPLEEEQRGAGGADMVRAQSALWRANLTVPVPGYYEIRFASTSGGFGFSDLPPMTVLARGPPSPSPNTMSSENAAGPAVGLAIVILAAMVALRRGRLD
jgi:hypothetical protein